ncbi:MAG: alpha-hydroxy-acid oxidizing protein [Desulfovibrionaceae bacterium]
MKDVRSAAREKMNPACRVCPVCDGKACRGQVPGMGGLGTGSSFTANVEALASVKLNMRLIHGVVDPDPGVKLPHLGLDLPLPVLAAPIGGVSFNMNEAVSEEDYITAKMAGCAEFGTLCGAGDGVPPFIHEAAYAAIKDLGGKGIPFIKPWEDEELYEKMEKARATGAEILGMDIDAAGLITLKLMGRPVSPKTPQKLAEIIQRWGGRFILKGVMTPDEALLAADAGASAIVVSNHGGRVLDHTPGTAEVLPAIAEAASGKLDVLVDGGVRTGADVLKMLALGADAVMIGRPFSVASVGGGKEGVTAYLNQLKTELVQAMVMTGTQGASSVGGSILRHCR